MTASKEDPRLVRIVEVLMAYARQDFTPRLEVSERLDDIDAIATGINLLAEELDGEVASRKDLITVLAALQAAQQQLVATEKLAAIGQLASGVAHELNNPATWVLLGLEVANRRLASARKLSVSVDPAVHAALDAISEAMADVRAGVERMRAVVADLGTLSRTDEPSATCVDLDELVRASCQLARPSYLSIARLTLDLGNPPAVLGDRAKVGQVVTNLVVNAAHALMDRPAESNEIVVRTQTDGAYALLVVEDSGPGISAELRERVFEPYFTTKPFDIGTGLGLALVRRIAEHHGGSARATESPTSGGARIEVRLPLATAADLTKATAYARVMHGHTPPTGLPTHTTGTRPRVLLIDDETLLLKTIAEAMSDDSDVVTALGGDAALAILAADRDFDLVICDLQMPRTDGAAIHAALEAMAPELATRLVIMSGGAVTPRARQFIERVRPRILAKPLAIDEVIRLLHSAAAKRRR